MPPLHTPDLPKPPAAVDQDENDVRIFSFMSSQFPNLAAMDAAIEAKIDALALDGWALDQITPCFSGFSNLVPVAGPGGRIINSGGQPAGLELVVHQLVYVQLVFVKE